MKNAYFGIMAIPVIIGVLVVAYMVQEPQELESPPPYFMGNAHHHPCNILTKDFQLHAQMMQSAGHL